MALTVGNTNVTNAFVGSTQVKQIYAGATLIWSSATDYYNAGTELVPFSPAYSLGGDGSVTELSGSALIQAGWGGLNADINERSWATTSSVDLTNVNTLYIDWDIQTLDFATGTAAIVAGTSRSVSFTSFSARTVVQIELGGSTGRQTSSVNVSSLSGNFFIRVHARDTRGTLTGTQVTVYRIWGE